MTAKPNRKAEKWEDFNKEFWTGYNGDDGDGPVHILWFDKLGTFDLKGNVVVEIELMTNGYSDRYEGYMVRLIHKTNGKLTQHYFKFDDYLEERDDDRNDYPLEGNICFYVSSTSKKVDWYIANPSFDDIADYQSRVMTFIGEYGEARPRRS